MPGKNLFEVDEAITKGTIIMNLLSDAAQSETWPHIKPQITKGKASHNTPPPIYLDHQAKEDETGS